LLSAFWTAVAAELSAAVAFWRAFAEATSAALDFSRALLTVPSTDEAFWRAVVAFSVADLTRSFQVEMFLSAAETF
jgi:hypothetical protein